MVFTEDHRGLGHGLFLLPVSGEPTLITDPRKHRSDLVPVKDVRAVSNLMAATIDLIRERGLDRGLWAHRRRYSASTDGPGTAGFTTRALRDPRFKTDRDLSIINSESEQAALRQAASVADSALEASIAVIRREGATERSVCAAGIFAACPPVRFRALQRVTRAPGRRSVRAGRKQPTASSRGDLILLDAIGAVDGYQFDVNRSSRWPHRRLQAAVAGDGL